MPSSSRSAVSFAALAALLATATGCSSSSGGAQTCQSSSQCPATARCISGACVENASPRASVAVPPALRANVLLSFDGGASADPDSGDSIVSYGWAFRPISAQCAPPVVAGTGALANVRFACPGRYAVDLTVTDRMSAHGVDTKEFDVVAYSGPALLTVSPDVAVDHACGGAPTLCAPVAPVVVSAIPTAAAPTELSITWTVEPPAPLTLGPNRRVTLGPNASSPSPAVSIETDGQAISGDWIFHVEARDAAGVVASGAVRVSVGNRPPLLTAAMPSFDHLFDALRAQFTMDAKIVVDVVDPDGDDLVDRTVSGHHAGDGGATFGVLDQADGVAVSVKVPYAAPSDAAFLIGGAGLERSVTFSISDVNRATVRADWPVVIGNRPPAPVSLPGTVSIDHAFDAAGSRYVASAVVSSWSDPDGDPIFPAGPTSDAACADLQISAGDAQVRCARAYAGTPDVGQFAGTHAVTHQVADPWNASAPITTTLQIRNRAPRQTVTSAGPPGNPMLCHVGAECFCEPGMQQCFLSYHADPASFDVTSFAADDDGDPIEVLVTPPRGLATPQASVCMPANCAFHVDDPGIPDACGLPRSPAFIGITLRDGGQDATGAIAYATCR
jgi:hypothetical protein